MRRSGGFEGAVGAPDFIAAATVVLRWRFVVSADGGGGRLARIEAAGRTEARQRKHSPVP